MVREETNEKTKNVFPLTTKNSRLKLVFFPYFSDYELKSTFETLDYQPFNSKTQVKGEKPVLSENRWSREGTHSWSSQPDSTIGI